MPWYSMQISFSLTNFSVVHISFLRTYSAAPLYVSQVILSFQEVQVSIFVPYFHVQNCGVSAGCHVSFELEWRKATRIISYPARAIVACMPIAVA